MCEKGVCAYSWDISWRTFLEYTYYILKIEFLVPPRFLCFVAWSSCVNMLLLVMKLLTMGCNRMFFFCCCCSWLNVHQCMNSWRPRTFHGTTHLSCGYGGNRRMASLWSWNDMGPRIPLVSWTRLSKETRYDPSSLAHQKSSFGRLFSILLYSI